MHRVSSKRGKRDAKDGAITVSRRRLLGQLHRHEVLNVHKKARDISSSTINRMHEICLILAIFHVSDESSLRQGGDSINIWVLYVHTPTVVTTPPKTHFSGKSKLFEPSSSVVVAPDAAVAVDPRVDVVPAPREPDNTSNKQ